MRKLYRLHNSPRWFSIGVPVRQRRCLAFQAAANLRGEALRVLDVLRFIERDDVPLLRLHHIGIAHEQRVACDDEIVLLEVFESLLRD
jgi:hypothetical protein